MRVLFLLGKDKSALSNMVGYVLLISITIGLSILVYGWLRFYVDVDEIEKCPDGVDIVVNSYECYPTGEFGTGRLKVIFKNKGRFVTDGFTFRVHDRPGADFGFYVLDDVGVVLAPGEEYEQTYEFSDYDFDGHNLSTVTLAEVQPFLLEDDKISCRSHVMQEISCYWGGSSGGGGGEVLGYCGDGVVDLGLGEECDDGNSVDNDGCDNNCNFSFYSFSEGCFTDYSFGMTLVGGAMCSTTDYCACGIWLGVSSIILDTPSLPFLGNYNVTFEVGLNGRDNESYQFLCGSQVYDFSDLVYDDRVVSLTFESVLCDFDSGVNNMSFVSTADGSAFFYSIEISNSF